MVATPESMPWPRCGRRHVLRHPVQVLSRRTPHPEGGHRQLLHRLGEAPVQPPPDHRHHRCAVERKRRRGACRIRTDPSRGSVSTACRKAQSTGRPICCGTRCGWLKPKTIRPHQQEALADVRAGLAKADRGKLIMACGTGKTFTGLKIAEDIAGTGRRVLFLVPSLALMSPDRSANGRRTATRRCTPSPSAPTPGRQAPQERRTTWPRSTSTTSTIPATTDAGQARRQRPSATTPDSMTVVFSTYHSIEVDRDAQRSYGLPEFDLIICDEAHRTTGATLDRRGREQLRQGPRPGLHRGPQAPLHDRHAAHLRRRGQKQGRARSTPPCARWTTKPCIGETLFAPRLRRGGRRTAC